MKPFIHTALAAALLSTTAMAAQADHGYSLSLELGHVQSDIDQDIAYAVNTVNNGLFATDLGNGALTGIRFSMPLADNLDLSLRYRGTALDNDDTASTGPDSCNIGATLGRHSDCWDAARFTVDTESTQIDVAVEFPLVREGNAQLTPFVGVRYLDSSQAMHTDHFYDDGYSTYTSNLVDYDSYGLFAGVRGQLGLGERLTVNASLSGGKQWGERSVTVYDYNLYGPMGPYEFRGAEFAHDQDSLSPWVAEAELSLGIRLGENAPTLELGYQAHYVEDLIDSRNTNTDVAPLANTIGGSQSLWQHSLFARVRLAF